MNEKFSDILFSIIFNDKWSNGLLKFINCIPDFTKNYSYEYNENKIENNSIVLFISDNSDENLKELNFIDYVSGHFNTKFIIAYQK